MSTIMKLSEVTVKVTSVIENLDASGLVADEPERTETTAVGYLHVYENDTALVTYRESGEGGTVTTEIAVRGKTVTVSRKGAIESCMVFEEGKSNKFVYSIPPYRFDAEIITKRMRCEDFVKNGRIELYYNMKIGGADKAARMKIWILPNSSLA